MKTYVARGRRIVCEPGSFEEIRREYFPEIPAKEWR